jgi:hypothetical protein
VRQRIKPDWREHRFERGEVNRACRFGHIAVPSWSDDFSRHHGPPMNGERRDEPWAAELPDDIENASLVNSLPDEA